MKRSFKVATVFAGVGAAAGALGPVAFAAPANAAVPMSGTGPAKECGANDGGVSNWVHFYYPHDDHPAMCIDGPGKAAVKGTIASFCPGNNFGKLFGSADGYYASFNFVPTQGRRHVSRYDGHAGNFNMKSISIFIGSGHHPCT